MSGILCLKWNNHTSTFIKTLDSLRSKELYCDATIVCHGKYFPVHQFVLTTCSEYFEEIFERTQCKHPFIIIKDLEELQLEALLNYMYKGEVNVIQDKLPGLIRAAESLRVRGLAVSEDESDECKSGKEKKRSNLSSSPSQPKKKKPAEEKNRKDTYDTSDEEVMEIENISPNSSKKKKYPTTRNGPNEAPKSHPTVDLEKDCETTPGPPIANQASESEIEDIKIEPSEIFENIEEDYHPDSVDPKDLVDRKDESLFVSLLSPSSTQISEEELLAIAEANNHAIPQCSSWSDEVSTNSDKIPDDMSAMGMKTMVKLQDGGLRSVDLRERYLGNCSATEAFVLLNAPHQCPHCPCQTQTKSALSKHVAYCHNEYKFVCGFCQYKCRTNGLLKKHMLKHSKEKPYSCPLCTYKTARKQHLVRHSKLHTGEKPFSCPMCSYKASRKDRLREHLRKHQTKPVSSGQRVHRLR